MKQKIALIDDNLSLLDCLKEVLEISGYDVVAMKDGNLIGTAIFSVPDLLLLDVELLISDGYEICKVFNRDSNTQHVPVILMSADYLNKKRLCDVSYVDFLLKPFGIDMLLEKITKHLRAEPDQVLN